MPMAKSNSECSSLPQETYLIFPQRKLFSKMMCLISDDLLESSKYSNMHEHVLKLRAIQVGNFKGSHCMLYTKKKKKKGKRFTYNLKAAPSPGWCFSVVKSVGQSTKGSQV